MKKKSSSSSSQWTVLRPWFKLHIFSKRMYPWQEHLQNWFEYTRYFTSSKLIGEKISRFACWNKKNGNFYLSWLYTVLISIIRTQQTTFETSNAFFSYWSKCRQNVKTKCCSEVSKFNSCARLTEISPRVFFWIISIFVAFSQSVFLKFENSWF